MFFKHNSVPSARFAITGSCEDENPTVKFGPQDEGAL